MSDQLQRTLSNSNSEEPFNKDVRLLFLLLKNKSRVMEPSCQPQDISAHCMVKCIDTSFTLMWIRVYSLTGCVQLKPWRSHALGGFAFLPGSILLLLKEKKPSLQNVALRRPASWESLGVAAPSIPLINICDGQMPGTPVNRSPRRFFPGSGHQSCTICHHTTSETKGCLERQVLFGPMCQRSRYWEEKRFHQSSLNY